MTPQGKTIVAVKDAAKNKYAWPGGYPLFILLYGGDTLCCDCAKKNLGYIAMDTANEGSTWRAIAVDINWEDTDMYCVHCNEKIESAYGENL